MKKKKTRITITLDQDVASILERLGGDRLIKTSPYINKLLRRHFLRPGKGLEQYSLKTEASS